MTDESPPDPFRVSESSLERMEAETRRIGTHDFDADDFEWVPVSRRRHNPMGWTVMRQRQFIQELADHGSVTYAANKVGMTEQSCYRLRRQPGAAGFARAWEAAIEAATARLVDVAMERALNGTPRRVCDADGHLRHIDYVCNDRLLMFMLRAHRPQRYARADARVIARDALAAPAAAPAFDPAFAAIGPRVPDAVQFDDPDLLANMVLNHMPDQDEFEPAAEAAMNAEPASSARHEGNSNQP